MSDALKQTKNLYGAEILSKDSEDVENSVKNIFEVD